jgi:hypothetical protein
MVDLDDILDSAAADVLPPKPESNPNKERVVTADIKPWLAYSANVPKNTRDNWTKISKIDSEADMPSNFQLSYAYRSWDSSSSGGAQSNGVNKCLQEMIRKTAFKCGIDDARTAKILSVVNPVTATDKDSVKQINRVFSRQIVTDMKEDIKMDPNYDAAKFPNLAAAM